MAVPTKLSVRIENEEAYTNWDEYCCRSLHQARAVMSEKRPERYKTISEVLQFIARIISTLGWKGFVTIVAVLLTATATGSIGVVATLLLSSGISWPVTAAVVVTGAAFGGGTGFAVYKLYRNKQMVIKVKIILEKYRPFFMSVQPCTEDDSKHQLDGLFGTCVEEIITELYEVEIMIDGKFIKFV